MESDFTNDESLGHYPLQKMTCITFLAAIVLAQNFDLR